MINDFDLEITTLQPYDQLWQVQHCVPDSNHDLDNEPKRCRVSSLCYHLKKKIKRRPPRPARPSLEMIDEGVRNVKIFTLTSQNNLDGIEPDSIIL